MKTARLWLFATPLVALAGPAQAQDAWMHWPSSGDAGLRTAPSTSAPAPSAPAQHTMVNADAQVRLEVQRRGDGVDVYVDNPLAGPITARIHSTGSAPPVRMLVTVPARTHTLVGQVEDSRALALDLAAIPGPELHALPAPVTDSLPVPFAALHVTQGAEGHASHGDAENREAVDFAAPLGTPVLAARSGVVMQVEQTHPDRDPSAPPDPAAPANHVRLLHADGSMGLYAHLQRGSVAVQVGDRVEAGQPIGAVGNSGNSTAPHLHYAVQVNHDGRLESIPLRIRTSQGDLRVPRGQ